MVAIGSRSADAEHPSGGYSPSDGQRKSPGMSRGLSLVARRALWSLPCANGCGHLRTGWGRTRSPLANRSDLEAFGGLGFHVRGILTKILPNGSYQAPQKTDPVIARDLTCNMRSYKCMMADSSALNNGPLSGRTGMRRNASAFISERAHTQIILHAGQQRHQVQLADPIRLLEQAPRERSLATDRNIFWSRIVSLGCSYRHHTLSPTPRSVGL